MLTRRLAFIVAAVIVAAAPASAEDGLSNRFTMEKTENGYIRMDRQTGEMSLCVEQAGQLVCKLAADERRAFEEALSDLSARVAALEELAARESRNFSVQPRETLPDDEEIERSLTIMEKTMRRFFDMFDELRKDLDQDKDKAAPPPSRT